MMKVLSDGTRVPIKLWTEGVELEPEAEKQLRNVASLPCVGPHVAVMPDVHWGKGATVGSVIPTENAIIPAAVGVDLGCGMVACRLPVTASQLPDNLDAVRSAIEEAVPHGRTDNGGSNDRGAWRDPPKLVENAWSIFMDVASRSGSDFVLTTMEKDRALRQLGTLGTGNHFVELCIDDEDAVWVMLHSGSRGFGNRIGSQYIALAKREMEKWFISLPDSDLAYLPEGSEHFDAYVRSVSWAQDYARVNREIMLTHVVDAVRMALDFPDWSGWYPDRTAVNCHHNYVSRERHFGKNLWITRKGAVSARDGEFGIIPGSMGAKSFIVRGKGNRESFHSCSHGAGRRMSRGEAKRRFSVEDHVKATQGISCRKDADVLDETPGAYKDIEAVMAAQSDLVEIVYTLHQVVCVKG